jgi:hypothetical protein
MNCSSLWFANTDGMHRAGPKYRHLGNELLIHVKETSMGGHSMKCTSISALNVNGRFGMT